MPVNMHGSVLRDVYLERRKTATNDKQRAMLDQYIAHIEAETIDLDLERLLSTMTKDPSFEFYGTSGFENFSGAEAVRAYYTEFLKIEGDIASIETPTIRILISEEPDALITEANYIYSLNLMRLTFPDVVDLVDAGRDCYFRKRVCYIVPFENGKMAAEIHYFDGPLGAADVVYQD